VEYRRAHRAESRPEYFCKAPLVSSALAARGTRAPLLHGHTWLTLPSRHLQPEPAPLSVLY